MRVKRGCNHHGQHTDTTPSHDVGESLRTVPERDTGSQPFIQPAERWPPNLARSLVVRLRLQGRSVADAIRCDGHDVHPRSHHRVEMAVTVFQSTCIGAKKKEIGARVAYAQIHRHETVTVERS